MLSCSYMALCAFNFGFDVGNFGGVQAMQRECFFPFSNPNASS